ncbi:MAG: hypothetical protein ACRBN8_43980 [Nannocystales bacterium]
MGSRISPVVPVPWVEPVLAAVEDSDPTPLELVVAVPEVGGQEVVPGPDVCEVVPQPVVPGPHVWEVASQLVVPRPDVCEVVAQPVARQSVLAAALASAEVSPLDASVRLVPPLDVDAVVASSLPELDVVSPASVGGTGSQASATMTRTRKKLEVRIL